MEYMEQQMQQQMEAGEARMEAFYDDLDHYGLTAKEIETPPGSFKAHVSLMRNEEVVFTGDYEAAEQYILKL